MTPCVGGNFATILPRSLHLGTVCEALHGEVCDRDTTSVGVRISCGGLVDQACRQLGSTIIVGVDNELWHLIERKRSSTGSAMAVGSNTCCRVT